jgi:hypothetical protein
VSCPAKAGHSVSDRPQARAAVIGSSAFPDNVTDIEASDVTQVRRCKLKQQDVARQASQKMPCRRSHEW